jgi:hypothetical protein
MVKVKPEDKSAVAACVCPLPRVVQRGRGGPGEAQGR